MFDSYTLNKPNMSQKPKRPNWRQMAFVAAVVMLIIMKLSTPSVSHSDMADFLLTAVVALFKLD